MPHSRICLPLNFHAWRTSAQILPHYICHSSSFFFFLSVRLSSNEPQISDFFHVRVLFHAFMVFWKQFHPTIYRLGVNMPRCQRWNWIRMYSPIKDAICDLQPCTSSFHHSNYPQHLHFHFSWNKNHHGNFLIHKVWPVFLRKCFMKCGVLLKIHQVIYSK